MTDTTYCYPPEYRVLCNKLNIRDVKQLNRFERHSVVQRIKEGVPSGIFDLAHLCDIHRHLFQDIYDWAGKLRTTELSKDGHQFQSRRYIKTGMADVHRRLVMQDYLKHLKIEDFAMRAGVIIGDVNYVHPFREGNGRTQLLYMEQLAAQAGHEFDLKRIDRESWRDASRRAHAADYELMARCIAVAIERTRPDS